MAAQRRRLAYSSPFRYAVELVVSLTPYLFFPAVMLLAALQRLASRSARFDYSELLVFDTFCIGHGSLIGVLVGAVLSPGSPAGFSVMLGLQAAYLGWCQRGLRRDVQPDRDADRQRTRDRRSALVRVQCRFRPWPPFPTRLFATGSGHRPRTIRAHRWLTRGRSGSGSMRRRRRPRGGGGVPRPPSSQRRCYQNDEW